MKKLILVLLLGIISTGSIAADDKTTTTKSDKPQTQKSESIPKEKLEKLYTQAQKVLKKNSWKKAGKLKKSCSELKKAYRSADNKYIVDLAEVIGIAKSKATSKNIKKLIKTCNSIAKNKKLSKHTRVRAAGIALKYSVAPSNVNPQKARRLIKKFVKKYSKLDKNTTMLIAAEMAAACNDEKYQKSLIKKIDKKKLSNEWSKQTLASFDKGYVGKFFKASMNNAKGGKIKMPEATYGYVTIVDFWATWCPPCRRLSPKIKQVYEKYRKKKVKILGISLDSNRSTLLSYVKKHDYPWPQAFSGKGWKDPVARTYNIKGIPTLFVVLKDGRFFRLANYNDMEKIVKHYLKLPESDIYSDFMIFEWAITELKTSCNTIKE